MCSSVDRLFSLSSRLCTREHRRASNTRGVQHWSAHNIELKDMLNFGAVVLCWKYSTFRRSRDNLQLFQPWNSTLFLCSWRTRWVHFSLSGLKCAVGAHVLCRRWILNSPLSSLTPWATAKNDRGRSTVASQVFACRSTFVGVVLKSCLELMTEQLEKIAKDLPNGFLWGPNDQAEGLRRRFLDHEAPFGGSSPTEGEFYHVRASIWRSFLGVFSKVLEIRFALINWAGFRCVLGSDFCCKREGFYHQVETKTR